MKRTLALLLAFCLLFTLPALAAPEDADVLPTLKALDIMVGDDAGNMNRSEEHTSELQSR